jgi:hypothetical protein
MYFTPSRRTSASLALTAAAASLFTLNPSAPVKAQAQFTCPVSECRMNQSTGTSSSVGVGVTSSFGVNSSAQSTSNYNASSSASLVLNSFDQDLSNQLGYNTSIQAIGSQASDSPIAITITSETIQNKSKSGDDSQYFNATNYTGDESSTSNAEFNAAGFGAMQDLRFKGGSQTVSDPVFGDIVVDEGAGSTFKADVIKIIDKAGAPEFGTGNANSGAETRTRFQADITTSNFVNAFMSAF